MASQNLRIVKTMAYLSAKRFSGKFTDPESLKLSVTLLIYDSEDAREFQLSEVLRSKLQTAMEKVLVDCSVGNYFPNERPSYGNVLNFILVDWPTPLEDMIRTRNGRSLLGTFANDAIMAIDCAMSNIINVEWSLRGLTRLYWIRRALKYFDAHDTESPYPRHRYTQEEGLTVDSFHNRRDKSFDDRNPPASPKDTDRILNIRAAVGSGECSGVDHFAKYENRGRLGTWKVALSSFTGFCSSFWN